MFEENLISVLIPCYNAERTIKKTINSVLNQTYKNFELIIVDDNSKDSTIEQIKKFKDKRISYFQNQTNLGFEKNWNFILKKAKGKYIKILPDDDTLEKDALLEQVNILNTRPNIILVSSKRNIIDENNKLLLKRGKKLGDKNSCKYKTAIKEIYRFGTNPIGEPGATLFRAFVVEKGITFDARNPHYIDLDFYVKILKYGDYYYIDKSLSNFRVWDRSYSFVNKFNNLSESIDFFKLLKYDNNFLTPFDTILNRFNIFKNQFLKISFYFIKKYLSR